MRKKIQLLGLLIILGTVYPQTPFTPGYPYVQSPDPAPAPNFYGPNYYGAPSDNDADKQKEKKRQEMMQNQTRDRGQEEEVDVMEGPNGQ